MKNIITTIFILGCLVALNLSGCRNPDTVSAKISIQNNDLDKAIEQLHNALATNPNDAEAHYLLSQIYSQKKMYVEMLDEFKATTALTNKYEKEIATTKAKHFRDLYNDSVEMFNQKKYDQALSDCKSAILIVPEDQAVWAVIARIYIKNNQSAEAVSALEQATKLDPKYEFMDDHVLLMKYYYDKAQYEKALDIALQILKIDSKQKEANRVAAFSYNSLKQSDKALEYYQKVLSDQPNDPDLNFNMGELYKAQQRYDDAIASYQQTMKFNPKDVEAILNIAGIYLEVKKDNSKAAEYYKKALELQSENPKIWNNLGVALIRLATERNNDQAIMDEGTAALNKGIELQGKNP